MGRPREFDTELALDQAMRLFWRKGYEGTSLQDLTDTLGLSRPSLYAAFGNKEALFVKVLDRYASGPAGFLPEALRAPTAATVMEALLRGAANHHADPANPPGCLMVHGALVGGEDSDPLRRETRRRRALLTNDIRKRLERARDEGDLLHDANPATLALYIVTVMRGMAVEAASGASGAELHEMVDLVVKGWPAMSGDAASGVPPPGRAAAALNAASDGRRRRG
jgi:AcrR family transcriptional regulator